jgi:hypothetical protein
MKLTRTTALVVLLFLAIAAPAAAFALADDDGDTGASHHATHPGTAKHDEKPGDDDADEPDHATAQEQADDASGPGRAHAEAMKGWAHCVAEAASGPKTGDRTGPPKDACGDKPMGPGLARHLADHSGPFAPGHGQDKQKAHGH